MKVPESAFKRRAPTPRAARSDDDPTLFGEGPIKTLANGTKTVHAKDLTPEVAKQFDATLPCPTCNGIWSKHGMNAGQWSKVASLVENRPSSLYMRCTPEQHAWIKRFEERKRAAAAESPAPANNKESEDMKVQLSSFLGASDISEDQDTVVTVEDVAYETLGRGADAKDKYILTFKGYDKKFVLNKTNLKSIVAATGSDETDEWIGKKLALFVKDDVEYQGQQVSAIRVRNKAPKSGAKQAISSAADDDTGL